MPLLGAHLSVSGGFHKAVDRATAVGCDVLQIFTHPPQQWPKRNPQSTGLAGNKNQQSFRAISHVEAQEFQTKVEQHQLAHPLSHTSYLLNLASPDEALRRRSIEACVFEMQCAEQLGIPYIVMHPGAHMGAGEETGIANIARSLREVLKKTKSLRCQILLETTAGQGSSLGHRFEHLAAILSLAKDSSRLGVCLDTCHLFAAGYPLQSQQEYAGTMSEFDRLVGLDRVRAIHVNDSKRELGSRVDRHEHIGRGKLGLSAFRNLLNDTNFRDMPMYLETPKGTQGGEDLDAINLRALRKLIVRRKRKR